VLKGVRATTSVPVVLVHCDESVGTADPGGTCTPVTVIDELLAVTLPVRPTTDTIGLHEAKSGTLKVKLTVIVLLSHGYGDDCVIPHFHAPVFEEGVNEAVRINMALPS